MKALLLACSLALPVLPQADFAAREAAVLAWEARVAATQPPEAVMDALGLKPGMTMGEVGAGRGRFTLHFARRVGPAGKVYANDILAADLDFLAQRCRAHGVANVQTVLGSPEDPNFPAKNLDLIGMVWTYHMMDKPVEMLKSLVPYLKPGGRLAMVEPALTEIEKEILEHTQRTGKKPTGIHGVDRTSLAREAALAGLVLESVNDTLLKTDVIYVLRKACDPHAGLEPRAAGVLQGTFSSRAILPGEGRALHDLLVQRKDTRVVDVGTGEGLSTLWLALAMRQTGGKVVSLELDPRMLAQARARIEAAGLAPWVDLRLGDALELIPRLEGRFDFVFMDTGVPGLNKRLFDLLRPRLAPGGALACHGEAQLAHHHPDYLRAVKADPDLACTVLAPSFKDGIALATRRR